jgi:hypothetical protein
MNLKIALSLVLSAMFLSGSLFAQQPTSAKSGKADSLFFASKWETASKEYIELLGAQNSNALLLNRLGFCFQNMGNYKKAFEYYEKSESNKPATAVLRMTLYSRMAKCYATVMDYKNALIALQKAMEAGYINFTDMDSAIVYQKIRNTDDFKKIRDSVYYHAWPCMANSHAREFDFWIGEWDVYATGTQLLQGHSFIERVSGGCLIMENWTSLGLPYNGKSMNFVDSTGKWQQIWVGASETGGPVFFVNGEYKDTAMRFVFTGRGPNGNTIKGKFIFFNQGPDQVRQFQQTSNDDGKTWQTVYDFTYIRKKAKKDS